MYRTPMSLTLSLSMGSQHVSSTKHPWFNDQTLIFNAVHCGSLYIVQHKKKNTTHTDTNVTLQGTLAYHGKNSVYKRRHNPKGKGSKLKPPEHHRCCYDVWYFTFYRHLTLTHTLKHQHPCKSAREQSLESMAPCPSVVHTLT